MAPYKKNLFDAYSNGIRSESITNYLVSFYYLVKPTI